MTKEEEMVIHKDALYWTLPLNPDVNTYSVLKAMVQISNV